MNLPSQFDQLEFRLGNDENNADKEPVFASYRVIKDNREYWYMSRITEQSDEIVLEDANFVNGFKRVQFRDNTFGYKNEKGDILPYRFCIASNFNEYGFAMVGRSLGVTWINDRFETLVVDNDGNHWTPLTTKRDDLFCFDPSVEFPYAEESFIALDKFSNSNRASSQVFSAIAGVFYIDKEGKLITFKEYGGTEDDFATMFDMHDIKDILANLKRTRFNSDGYALRLRPDGIVLFDRGVYAYACDVIALAEDTRFLSTLSKSPKLDSWQMIKEKPY